MKLVSLVSPGLLLIASLATSCGGEQQSSSGSADAAPPVPELPSYIDSFDPSVRDLVLEAHGELAGDALDPGRWMKLGMAYEAHSEAALAADCYRGAVSLDDQQARWWYRLAMALQGNDQLEEGLVALERSLVLHDGHGPAHWRKGLWLLELSREEEARVSFERAIELDPADETGHIGLVQVHLRLGENDQAARALEGSPILLGANGPWATKLLGTAYQRVGREDEARNLLANSKAATPVQRDSWNDELDGYRRGMAAINRQARALIAAGRAPRAVEILEGARVQNPDHVPILRTLGAAYATAGRTKSALEVLKSASELEPENTELRIDTAWAHAMHGELQAALGDALEILQEAPENNKAHILHAQLLMDLGRDEEAIAAFQSALEFGARNPAMLVDIGKKQIGLGRLEDSLASFVLAANQSPVLQSAWIGQAIVNIEMKRFQAADIALKRVEVLAELQPGGADPVVGEIRSQLTALQQEGTREDGGADR